MRVPRSRALRLTLGFAVGALGGAAAGLARAARARPAERALGEVR